jgi:hypothetical protein
MKTEISVVAPSLDDARFAVRIARGSRIATAFLTPDEAVRVADALSKKNFPVGKIIERIEVEKETV